MEELKWNAHGLVCAIAQDFESGEVLMQAYMNEEAYKLTLETGYAHYWSRSRQKLWKKGEESGHLQKVRGVYLDCDKDCVLLKVEQVGAACHTGNYTCFFTPVKECGAGAEMLGALQRIVEDRKQNPEEGSYTNYLFDKGVDKIAKKAGEEAASPSIWATKSLPCMEASTGRKLSCTIFWIWYSNFPEAKASGVSSWAGGWGPKPSSWE